MDRNPMNDIPGVPPPPPEVKVRTMKSDIDSMAKSGGGLPQFQNVTVAGLAVEHAAPAVVAAPQAAAQMAAAQASAGIPPVTPSAPVAAEESGAEGGGSHNIVGIILVIVVALLAAGAVWYFAAKELGAPSNPAPAVQTSTTP